MDKPNSTNETTFHGDATGPIHTGSGNINIYQQREQQASQSPEPQLDRQKLKTLRQMLATYFSASERRTLCFDLGFHDHSLPGNTHEEKVAELISYCQRNKQLSELLALCREERPMLNWPSL